MENHENEQEPRKYDFGEIVSDLLWVADECDSRCMFDSSKWAYEILSNLSPLHFQVYEKSTPENAIPPRSSSKLSMNEQLIIKHAKELIRDKEFHRAKFFLEQFNSRGTRETFLYYWTWYMISVRERQEAESEGLTRKQEFLDDTLAELGHELEKLKRDQPEIFDCYLNTLLGLIRSDNQTKSHAREAFTEAIRQDHRCWPAWNGLASCLEDKGDVNEMNLPTDKWQHVLFMGEAMFRLRMLRTSIEAYNVVLESILGHVPYVICQIAAAMSSLQEHESAIQAFEKVRKSDPFRIEQMNLYSDSLYIRANTVALASLAHHFYETHKYTWQTCCILGNYYSSRKEHTKSQEFLLRATRLSPYDSSIWVLLGHEFMETKNNSAAILAYRKATVLDSHCYRGWYGLGQLYELLKAFAYSLYYYEQAHRRRPDDSRILVALGVCFVKLGRLSDAEKCFKKAFQIGDLQGNALTHLGKLYEDQNENSKAAKVYETYLRIYSEEMIGDLDSVALCCRFLTKHYLETGDLDTSYQFAQRCLTYDKTKEEGYYYLRLISRKRQEKPDENTGILSDFNSSMNRNTPGIIGRSIAMSEITVTPGEEHSQSGSVLDQTIKEEEQTSQQIEDMAISDDDNLEISF